MEKRNIPIWLCLLTAVSLVLAVGGACSNETSSDPQDSSPSASATAPAHTAAADRDNEISFPEEWGEPTEPPETAAAATPTEEKKETKLPGTNTNGSGNDTEAPGPTATPERTSPTGGNENTGAVPATEQPTPIGTDKDGWVDKWY